MNTSMLVYIFTMGFTVLIFGGITYLFTKKRDYSLLSGFANRPDEEKEYLKKSGYLRAMSKLFRLSFWLLLITFIVGIFPIRFAFEIGMSIFILHLMIGIMWVQRYEVPEKRKKMLWITGIIASATIIFIIVISSLGLISNNITITESRLEISGMYGDEWALSDIQEVHLFNNVPRVIVRTNGFAASAVLKGHFNLEEPYGKALLFIQNKSDPCLYIKTTDEHIFINRKSREKTKELYHKLH